MISGTALSFEAFWNFSLDRYAREGVSTLCLEMQDRFGADVNVLLWCLFAAQCGIALTGADIDAAIAGDAGRWHRTVVVPLRTARRAMKSPPADLGDGRIEVDRKRLKAIELESERIEQVLLFEALPRSLPAVAAGLDRRRRIGRAALAAHVGEPAAGTLVDALLHACLD